jgi:hypothetical protein
MRHRERQDGLAGRAVATWVTGWGRWTVPRRVFGVPVENLLAFTATEFADGAVQGQIYYTQAVEGERFRFRARVIRIALCDGGRRARCGGVVEESNDPTLPPGTTFMWFEAITNGRGRWAPPDQSTIPGFGDAAAHEAFCADDAPPGQVFDLRGAIHVRAGESPRSSNPIDRQRPC